MPEKASRSLPRLSRTTSKGIFMCDTGECRPCRQALRELDKTMGSVRSYISARPPGREANEDTRKVVGGSLMSNRTSVMTTGEAPVNFLEEGKAPSTPSYLLEKRKPTRTKAERTRDLREARKEDRELIDGRLVSVDCPCHGTYNGYLNWYCRCLYCSIAHSNHKADRKLSG